MKTFTVDNDLPGATKLRDEILHTVQGESVHELRIGLKSTSVYSFHPSMFLHNDEFIQALGGQVFVMNPKQIANFKKSYSDMDKSIERIMKGVPQTLQTIPGVGPVFTAGIIAEIGQIERFENEAKITKYAGLYWRKHQSGRFTAEDTSLSRNGNQYLRYYLVEAANSVRRQIPEYSDYYTKKYQEVPKHQHKRALVLTARKFVRLVDALLRKNQIYTPKRSVMHEA